jgi:tryptophanyl-tRNA synthetase
VIFFVLETSLTQVQIAYDEVCPVVILIAEHPAEAALATSFSGIPENSVPAGSLKTPDYIKISVIKHMVMMLFLRNKFINIFEICFPMPEINAWGSGRIEDYEHVFEEFGLSKFTEYNLTDSYLFSRHIIIAHRDFSRISDAIKNRKKFLQLTGIASSGDLHLGHKLDIDFYLLFRALGAKSRFCVSDIDGYVSRPDAKVSSIDAAKEIAVRNAADAIALGIPPEEIYAQSQKEKEYYQLTYEISKKITNNMFDAIYGHTDLGKISAVLLQIADILHIQMPFMFGKAPTITGIGIDQDPHARLTRDVSKRLGYSLEVPSFFYFRHLSGLKEGSKMSSSEPDTAIFLKDSPEEVKRKISKCFTGGRESVEEQRKTGGKPEICKVYEILTFHNPDENFVSDTHKNCKSGKLLCGECKKNCIGFLNEMLKEHQEKYKKALPAAKKIVYGK